MNTEKWMLIQYEDQNKTVARAIDCGEIQSVVAGSRLVGMKLQRSFVIEFKNGSTYEIPEDAKVQSQPRQIGDLMGELSRIIRV